jgi:DNA-binding response OmpR family regulator
MVFAVDQKKILIIEDNPDIAQLIQVNLADANLSVEHAADGESGLRMAMNGEYSSLILDLMLPGLDGLEICRRLRASGNFTPILMLTAKSSELDRVLGLELGADDYLTKPFSVPELTARVKAILRRAEHYLVGRDNNASDCLVFGDLSIDAAKRLVSMREQPVELTAKEFDLLWFFATQPGRVFSRAQLLDSVWGYGHDGYEHTVNSHINRLRAKIEDNPNKPAYVLTVWGVGYKFRQQDMPQGQ